MKVRALFLSDCHLGSEHSNYLHLLDIISNIECENIYLVGDFIDGWLLKNKFRWKQEYNTIIQKLLRHSRKGTTVHYIWGNHDDFLQHFDNYLLGENIIIKRQTEHITAKGKRYIVIHGDQFDGVICKHKWMQIIGAYFYEISLFLNKFTRYFKFSFSKFLKNKAKEAVKFVAKYEDTIIDYAKRSQCKGIITGHIHKPESYTKNNIHYVNCGDFVESNTYVIETLEGDIELRHI
jgi:UDP-2,3-diacylglucosamine pyrophosphatase LpxH